MAARAAHDADVLQPPLRRLPVLRAALEARYERLYDEAAQAVYYFNKADGTRSSILRLQLAEPAYVASYALVTGPQQDGRDPTGWEFGLWYESSQTFAALGVQAVDPPTGRVATYGRFWTIAPPAPPSPPAPPRPPPLPPTAGLVYQFVFDAVRGPAVDGIQLSQIVLYGSDYTPLTIARVVPTSEEQLSPPDAVRS